MLNGLDLFSGIGGLAIALKEWVRPLAYCEIDQYCQGLLISRMATEDLVKAPIWDDIRSFEPFVLKGSIDIIYGGFPCQDISVAGRGEGLEGKRSGLFFEIVRLAKEIKPKFIFLENVPAITSRGGLRVVREITEMGYDCRWCVISAESIGASHVRERFFLLAHSMRQGCADREKKGSKQIEKGPTLRTDREIERVRLWKEVVSSMDRTTDGLPNRVDQIRALGNAVVPAQAREAFRILSSVA
jgi:DNA (cytosine-5)-methyltransferase 1